MVILALLLGFLSSFEMSETANRFTVHTFNAWFTFMQSDNL